MIEWPLVFMTGMLGAAHCVGMCGPFVLTLGGSAPSLRVNVGRQLCYTAGRVFTYSTLGTVAGFAGWRLQKFIPTGVHTAAWLAIGAGLFLLYQGLMATGILRRRGIAGQHSPCLAGTFLGTFLTTPGKTTSFLAGLLTGLLPCGLLYGMLALAASARDPLLGWATMATFGLGTAPVMLLTGCGGSLLSLTVRRHLMRVAAWCLVLTGIVAVARGASFLSQPEPERGACPFCHARPQ